MSDVLGSPFFPQKKIIFPNAILSSNSPTKFGEFWCFSKALYSFVWQLSTFCFFGPTFHKILSLSILKPSNHPRIQNTHSSPKNRLKLQKNPPVQRRHFSGQIIIFHQPRFPGNKGISLTKPQFGVRSCEVAIIWPEILTEEPELLLPVALPHLVGFEPTPHKPCLLSTRPRPHP